MRNALATALLLSVALCADATGQETLPKFIITTVAGDGARDFGGDGGPATDAHINSPTAVAVDPSGNLYIADNKNHRVRKVTPDGKISTFMGTGKFKTNKKDLPAKKMNLVQAYGIATDHEGNVYALNRGHGKIYKVTPKGKTRTIAGIGKRAYNGDGIPATEAAVAWPNHLVVAPDGVIYIADTGNQRIRMIDKEGIIHTIAGTGESGFSGDGGPATEAKLAAPSAIARDRDGNLYIADFNNHRIRKIDTKGIISTVAGTGERGYNGDGLIATEAQIGEPCGVAVDQQGFIYIGDQVNLRVRIVTPGGIMHTIAGIGDIGRQGDGGPSTEARISNPDIICFDRDENLYIPDYMNSVVRKLTRVISSV